MTVEQIRAKLAKLAELEGSQRALARKIGVSPTFLNDIMLCNRLPVGKVLAYIGLERRVIYVRRSTDRSSAK